MLDQAQIGDRGHSPIPFPPSPEVYLRYNRLLERQILLDQVHVVKQLTPETSLDG